MKVKKTIVIYNIIFLYMININLAIVKGASTILMLMKKTISYQSDTKSFVGLETKLVTECQPRDEAKCCKTPEYFLMDIY